MCGIAGFVEQTVADRTSVLDAMLSRIAHRGPDDRGVWSADGVSIGHVRLSIIDLSSRGHQPFVTRDGLGVLSYNGEVYNYRELRAELEREGVSFSSDCDTEVVLYALHLWGPERAVPRFNGMFALAYFDRRERSLWLTRDRAGIKPLYVARSGGLLAFASEQNALFAHPRIDCAPDTHAIITKLLYERLEGSMTLYQGVQAILPGTLHRIRDGHEAASTYFDVLRDLDVDRIVANGAVAFTEQARRFEERFARSVRMHLASDAPLATMCSGGLDSSLVTAFARDAKPDLVAYVADIEGADGEELRRAKIVCSALSVELRPVEVDTAAYFGHLPKAILANDQPPFFPQSIAGLLVAQAMRDDGFKVMLTGDGSDELFGGYPWHVAEYRSWRRRRLHARLIRDNRLTRILGRFHPLLRPLDLEALSANPFAPVIDRHDSLNVALVDGARRRMREARLFRKLDALPLHEDRAFLARGFEDVYVHLREHLGSMDRMAMHCSVENRVPFLENELIDFGLHMPLGAKYHRGVTKRLVKDLAEKRLPREVVHLPKIGFSVHWGIWKGTIGLLRDGRLAELLKWRRQDQADIVGLLSTRPYYQFALVATELWLRMRFGGESPQELSDKLGWIKAQAAS